MMNNGGANDAFDADATGSQTETYSAVDAEVLDAIGWSMAA